MTWKLVSRTPKQNVLSWKWMYKLKQVEIGKIERYKTRLVEKKMCQQNGIYFKETLAPVIKLATILLILSIVVTNAWELWQLEVTNTYLHGILEETIFMRQPLGFCDEERPDYVYWLLKYIYSLKLSPRVWFHRLCNYLVNLGFKEKVSDQSLFMFKNVEVTTYFVVYVDDIVITSSSSKFISQTIVSLREVFSIKDLGPLNFFLRIHVIWMDNVIFLSQQQYVANILEEFKLSNLKPAITPMEHKIDFYGQWEDRIRSTRGNKV